MISQRGIPHFSAILYLLKIAWASSAVVGSITVGPDAIILISFPGTSEKMSDTTDAGYAILANCPPWIREVCLRTVLTSAIVALCSMRDLVIAVRVSQEISFGRHKREDPPPEMTVIKRSRSVSPSARSAMDFVIAMFVSDGNG